MFSYHDKKMLTAVGNRHESRVQCECCKVDLCLSSDRNCLKKYYTLVDIKNLLRIIEIYCL